MDLPLAINLSLPVVPMIGSLEDGCGVVAGTGAGVVSGVGAGSGAGVVSSAGVGSGVGSGGK